MSNPNELRHYGTKGMKWGIRKQKSRVSRAKRGVSEANEEASHFSSEAKKLAGYSKGYSDGAKEYAKYAASKEKANKTEKNIFKRTFNKFMISEAKEGQQVCESEAAKAMKDSKAYAHNSKAAKQIARERSNNLRQQQAKLKKLQEASVPKVKKMSDTELKSTVDRMNLERSYRNLQADAKKANRSSLEIGADTVVSIGGSVAKSVVTTQLTSALNTTIKTQLEK